MDIEQLNKTPHNQICDLARDRFIEVYNQKFGEGGEVFFEEQKAFFNEELLNGSFKGYLEKAPSLNIHDAFMNLAINGLSLEKGTTTLCYLMGYSNYDKNTKTNELYGQDHLYWIWRDSSSPASRSDCSL